MKIASLMATTLLITACSNKVDTMPDRSHSPCGDKPNCVSTQDSRADFNLAPYPLKGDVSIDQIESIALSFPRATVATKESHYLRVEYRSKVFRFVDDMEMRIEDGQLLVRSESRTGYSDFNVNRKRADALRDKLLQADLIFADNH
nr:DUF1499 domain-containing protein [Vibrio hippocampi]